MAQIFITSGTSWAGVVTDGSDIVVECIGGGGGGGNGASDLGTGGGGGAYAVKSVPYASGTPVTVAIGAGGTPAASGGDTSWDSGVVLAKGGGGGNNLTAGPGGAAASCVPFTGAFSGGPGGGLGADSRAGAGGGGAAGLNGDGKAGGVGGASSVYNGAGGGGNSGGTDGQASQTSDPSGAGGNSGLGQTGAVGVSTDGANGNDGTNGAGASGGAGNTVSDGGNGGRGGDGVEYTTKGSGGGGGGGGGVNPGGASGSGGDGGNYGAGGGGAGWPGSSSGGNGAPGLIVVTYTPAGGPVYSPGPASITLTGGTPAFIVSAFFPGSAAIAITGGTPTLSFSGTETFSPGSASVTITGGTPVLHLDSGLAFYPDPATITITGGTPSWTLPLVWSPGTAQILIQPSTPAFSLVRTSASGSIVFIGDEPFCWKESTFKTTKTLSGNWSAEFQLDHFQGDTMPVVGQEVAMFWESVKRFGGLIQSVQEKGVQGNDGNSAIPHTVLTIKVGGFQLLTDRVIVADLVTITRGGVSGIIVYNIWYDKLRQFGVTKIGDAPSTFVGEQLFHYITVTECYNRVKDQDPGYDWWIDDDKLLHYERTDPLIGPNAPFTIRDGDRNVDFMTVTRSDVRFRNKQWVLPSADIVALRDDQRLGDGVSTSFSTDYVLTAKPIVRVDGTAQIVTEFGNWIPGWQFYYIPGGIGVFAATAPPSLSGVDILYPNPFPLAFSAEDDASIAAVGLYEAIWQAKNVYDQATAEGEAQGFLDLYSAGGFPIEIVFEYDSDNQPDWLLPGMVIDVDHTFPTALANCTVEQVDSQEIGATVWKHTVILRAGLGDVTDAQALQQFRDSARVPINSPPFRLTAELYQDLPGITNPGASVGVIKNTYVVQCQGVFAAWDVLFADDPPTGANLIIDAKLNGVSIFPAGPTNKIVAQDGVTTLQAGYTFVTDNLQVAPGDIVTFETLQAGSTDKGKNCTLHLYIKVPANAGTG